MYLDGLCESSMQTSTWDDVTTKSKRPHPWAQIQSQIPVGGEGKRGQMPHHPSGLTLIDALLLPSFWHAHIAP